MGAMLNGQPRRTVRSRRSSSVIAQAIAVLAKYGGSWWQSGPEYTFTGSDGTGAAGDNADTGYVRDLCGNARPLTQATTGFKPKLRRVPKRLGAELVSNGDFAAGSTGWVGATAGVSFSGGAVNIVSSSGEFQGIAQNNVLQAGKTYLAQADVVINSGVGGVTLSSGATNVTQTTTGKLYGTFTAPTHYIEVKRFAGAVNATVDNVSVREVIEWTWAWVFDGVDDILTTPSLPAGTDETIMVCATSLTNAGTPRAPIGKRSVNNGLFIRRESGGALNGHAMTGSGFGVAMSLESSHINFSPFLATVLAKSGASRGRFNGSQVATTSGVYAGWAGPLGVGSEKGMDSGTQWNGYVFAAAYAPAAIPDAELLIVERAMAQLGGVTI